MASLQPSYWLAVVFVLNGVFGGDTFYNRNKIDPPYPTYKDQPFQRWSISASNQMASKSSFKKGWWSVHAITCGSNGERSTLLGLKTSTLERAKEVGDSIAAVVSHRCNDHCQGWVQLPE